jgi:hypothetical protein
MKYIVIDFPASGEKKYIYGKNQILKMTDFRRSLSFFSGFENQTINITMDNSGGNWSLIMASEDRYLKGRNLKIYENQILKGTLKIKSFPKPKSPLEFVIRGDMYEFLSTHILPPMGDEFPDVLAENEGKRGNVFFGTVTDEDWQDEGQLTAYQVEPGKYLAARHHCFNVSSVSGYTYTFENDADGNCYIYPISCTETAIQFCGTGMIDEYDYPIENPGNAILKLVELFGNGIEIEGIDALLSVYNEKYTDTVIVLTDQTWKSFLSEYSINFDTVFYPSVEGKIQSKLLDFEDIQPICSFTPSMISKYEFHPETADIIGGVIRKYRYHFQNNIYRNFGTSAISSKWEGAAQPELCLKFHTESASSHDVAIEKVFRQRDIFEKVSFNIARGNMPETDILGGIVTVKYHHGLHPNEERPILVLSVEQEGAFEYCVRGLDILKLQVSRFRLLEEDDPEVAILLDEEDQDCLILL